MAGEGQNWDPVAYAAHASFVPALGAPVLDLLAPKQGERILDLGCGDGVLTAKLVAAGAEVVGVDTDRAMIVAAQERGLDVRRMDGRALDFVHEFDAVFTNAALHWMTPPARVAEGVYKALKPGGRYVGEFGGHGNVAAIRAALRGVLMGRGYRVPSVEDNYYPTPDEFRAVLEAAGFVVDRVDLIPRPTPVPSGMSAWLNTFRSGFIDAAGVPESERAQVIEDTRSLLRPVLADQAGNWTADYVRLRFAARKPE
ncbi:class I SAM-dependent methyltransferase [Sphingoaurantiacus capsulatus]|uniref:Class I SAM-dependent methyltransferase n=1 Tax=Sphingoaurantiacus capsulatus TaxID=1771310 RepID=A0ABV7XDB3_9SPHN